MENCLKRRLVATSDTMNALIRKGMRNSRGAFSKKVNEASMNGPIDKSKPVSPIPLASPRTTLPKTPKTTFLETLPF